MKLCIVGIGGAGGNITQEFLGNEDLDFQLLSNITDAQYISAGGAQGIWLEADKNEAKNIQHGFFGDIMEGCYPCFYIPHDAIPDGCDIHIAVREKYGYDVKKQGFVRDAQYLKAIFEIFDTDKEIQEVAAESVKRRVIKSPDGFEFGNNSVSAPNPIFDSAWNCIRGFTTLGDGKCDGVLFVVSFGGGTGTGFINPIINHIRDEGKADYPVFVLGVLTEMGDFADKAQFTKSGRRNLAAISATYDLLTRGDGANGVIILDNEILLKRYGNDYISANKFIYRMMQPLMAARDYPGEVPPSQAVAHHASGGLSLPPIFVPLFASLPRSASEDELIEKALSKEGRLFGCDPEKSDFAFVFCRGFIDSDRIRDVLSQKTEIAPEKIWPARKMGEGRNEILILLRNPYGGNKEAYKIEGTLENRFCKVIGQALKYVREQPEDLFYEGKQTENGKDDDKKADRVKLTAISKEALKAFFFGREDMVNDGGNTIGFVNELEEARKRLMNGEKPFFITPLRIFYKDFGSEPEKRLKSPELSSDQIAAAVDQRIKELIRKGVIKAG